MVMNSAIRCGIVRNSTAYLVATTSADRLLLVRTRTSPINGRKTDIGLVEEQPITRQAATKRLSHMNGVGWHGMVRKGVDGHVIVRDDLK